MKKPRITGAFALRRALFKYRRHPLFDTAYYVSANPDIAAAGVDPYAHYLKYGANEGRQPNSHFDPNYYANRWRISPVDALDHYWVYGARRGMNPHPQFNTTWYLNVNSDVAAAEINPLLHYLKHGRQENRSTLPPWNRSLLVGVNATMEMLDCRNGELTFSEKRRAPVTSDAHAEFALLLRLGPRQVKFIQDHMAETAVTGAPAIRLVLPDSGDNAPRPEDHAICILMRAASLFQYGRETVFEFGEAIVFNLVDGEAHFVANCVGDATSIAWCDLLPEERSVWGRVF